jgi:hypothetical protein
MLVRAMLVRDWRTGMACGVRNVRTVNTRRKSS